MARKLVGFFEDRESARNAIEALRENRFESNDISLVSRHSDDGETDDGILSSMVDTLGDQNLMDGTMTGGALGGLAGLALGAGTLIATPIGALLAIGPITGLLAGAVSGGVAGGLIDYGIPEESSQEYESRVEEGQDMVIMEVDEGRVVEASEVLRVNGAQGIDSH
ncbi:MAG TPA: DUF1269 domain-containing protein [Syntrophomonadaceae bacterium]|nr:DUF1269 domain-containing protein [Syntrophomonadaceae bacterium]